MAYIVIILVIIMAISPVIWMRPSPRQKQLVRLREHAAKMHMQVSIRTLPPRLQRRHDNPTMTCYLTNHPRNKQADTDKPRPLWYVSVVDAGFEWIGKPDLMIQEALQRLCATLPKGCCYLEAEQGFVGVYWLEQGTEERVDKIASIISEVMKLQNEQR
ncbi:hypothetical protein EDC56_2959 [Sinobacterium caligoides]|uniref:Preprotein translocase subunit YajC n=1 Tax=Sinobacterium caligoides TaxID=933926 RepID=A0A3N2DKI7_9GAMM|nr:hypothetical protein [Sinobacterium caligoides]ROS00313.1 hypothetical protein EDC56_2959 [Sinobacterium caligoides]